MVSNRDFELARTIGRDDFLPEIGDLGRRCREIAEAERLGKLGVTRVCKLVGQRITLERAFLQDFLNEKPVVDICIQSECAKRDTQQASVGDQLFRSVDLANVFGKIRRVALKQWRLVERIGLNRQRSFQERPARQTAPRDNRLKTHDLRAAASNRSSLGSSARKAFRP